MKNSAYWKRRFEILEQSAVDKGQKYLATLDREFATAQRRIEAELSTWYNRFAVNNGISLTEARKILNANQLAEFKWNVQDYIKYGEQNALNGQWMKQLENASARVHISRLEALQVEMQQRIEVLYGNQLDGVDNLARRVYEDGFYHSAFEIQRGFNVGWDLTPLNQQQLDRVISKPWTLDKETFSDRIWKQKNSLIAKVQTELTQSLLRGDSPDKAIKSISKAMSVSKSQAGRLVMTESAYFASEAQKDCFNSLDVERFEIVATLDSHTSELCESLDGHVELMKDYQAGVTAPPFHPWCRTTTIPYFEDNVGERAARDKDGNVYYVSSDMKYSEWKKSFVDGGSKDGLQKVQESGIIKGWKGLGYASNYTKQGAIDRLKSEYGIDFEDSRKYPMNADLLNDCVGWMDSFKGQYGGFMQNNPVQLPQIANLAPTKMPKNALGVYQYYGGSPKAVRLALNGQYHSDMTFFENYVSNSVKSGWSVANATVHKTFIHEFGHHVSNSMRWITKNPNWEREFIKECIDEFKKIEPSYTYNTYAGMKDFVSQYAASSNSELFAEAFGEYFGGENPRQFAKIFGEKLDKLLKGVK